MDKAQIREYVINTYIETKGNFQYVSDIAKACGTNAKGVRSALDENLNGFDYFQADKWSGSSFSGSHIQAWAVEPSKETLLKLIGSK